MTDLSQKCLKLDLYLKKGFVYYLGGFVLLMGFIMLIVRFNAWHIPGDDNGIPQNWFPSVMFFVTFLISIYLYFVYKNDNGKNTPLFLSLLL